MSIGQGPAPMALGGFAFRGLGFSFNGQDLDLKTPWASLKTTGRLDALQWTGPTSESFSIKGAIFDVEFGGQASLDGIKAAARAGKPLMLVTLAGRVMGRHVIEGVSEGRAGVIADGAARKNTYTIKLKRYSGNGIGFGGFAGLF